MRDQPVVRDLPIGRRTGLANPRGIGTAAPLSKVLGEPADLLTESIKVPIPRVISPFKPLPNKPLGAFEGTFEGLLIPDLGFTDRQKQRVETEQLDRQLRVRSAPKLVLGRGTMSGWDWIRYGRRIRPALPNGFLGHVAVTRELAERGVQSQQLEMPLAAADKLAGAAFKVSAVGPDDVPVSTASIPRLAEAATSPDPQVKTDPFQWGYLAAAVVIVFLVLRRIA